MKKFTYPLFLALTLFSSAAVMAQKTDTVKMHGWMKHQPAGAMQIQVTYRQGHISQLNNALNANGIPSIKQSDIWINASMSHICDKWMFEDGIGFTPIESSSVNDLKVKYNQYQLFWRAGYNVSTNTNVRVYPFVGVNFSAAVLNVQDKAREQNTTSLQDELLNSTSSKTLWQPNFGIELGAGFDYVIKLKPKKTDCFTVERNIPIGVRAGYYINTYAGDWKIDGYKLQNSPNQKQSAVFLTFNVGLGYKVKK
ncbi:hypothetical protein [Mucilaginibacter xinganensis]|uniref:Outer membrane protein beta-barrel domain-containing protein n=1 Tax=Mucilaginibacter xinganensis TaxID=1234841 RepID=A0A223NY91_9SPHI|nr:hypothetical protein [Mucilaginibacter xinganensis]ASU34674.1 hypothetical protein MuYL_2787 [Mucilaginibacter xinganensis]